METKASTVSHVGTRLDDWAAVHRRLETARAAIERTASPSAEEIGRILKSRAKALARETTDQKPLGAEIEVVSFLLAHESYAIEASYVREVYPLKELTPLAGTPPFVLGVTSVRGQILSVLDLKKFFDLPERGLTDLNKLIIVRANSMEFGILADSILGTGSIALAEIQPSVATLAGIRSDYLKGVTRDRLVILDAARIISDRRIIVHEEPKT